MFNIKNTVISEIENSSPQQKQELIETIIKANTEFNKVTFFSVLLASPILGGWNFLWYKMIPPLRYKNYLIAALCAQVISLPVLTLIENMLKPYIINSRTESINKGLSKEEAQVNTLKVIYNVFKTPPTSVKCLEGLSLLLTCTLASITIAAYMPLTHQQVRIGVLYMCTNALLVPLLMYFSEKFTQSIVNLNKDMILALLGSENLSEEKEEVLKNVVVESAKIMSAPNNLISGTSNVTNTSATYETPQVA